MTATEALREEVRELIDDAGDEKLRRVKAMLETELEEEDTEEDMEEDWNDLPEDFKKLLEEAIKETDEGGGMTHEEVKKMYPQWFKK